MSWSVAQVSNSTLRWRGVPEGATACVKVRQAAMSDDSPQGSLSPALADPAHATTMTATPINRRSIFVFPPPAVRGRHSGFNVILRIDSMLELKTRNRTGLFRILYLSRLSY